MSNIYCNFSEFVLLPKEAFDEFGFGPFRTKDGKVCDAIFISVWNNADCRYDEQLDHICQIKWNIRFDSVRSMWIGRLGEVGCYWYLIQLKERHA
jgi:hypothetical protein